MSAQIISGTELAASIRETIAKRAAELTALGHQPGLAVVLVGEDPASQVYVRNKVSACEKAGFKSVMHRMPENSSQDALVSLVQQLNADPTIHGILVQLPLPKGLDEQAVLDVEASSALTPAQKRRVIGKAGPVLRAVAQDERSQWRNRELAVERLADALREALAVPRRRLPTAPTKASRERRQEQKRRRSQTKRLRRPPT